MPKYACRSRAEVKRRGVIYAPSGSQTLDSRYTNLGHQLCPEHHIRLTGAAAGAPRAPQPRAGHKAPALLGHEEAGGCCRGALRNPPGKHKAPLAFPAAAVRSRMIHSPAKRSSLEEKYTREKKKNPHPYLSPYPQPFPVGPSRLAVCSHLGATRERRRQKDLEKNIISSVGFVVEHGHGSEAQPLALPTLGSLFQLGALSSSRGISAR